MKPQPLHERPWKGLLWSVLEDAGVMFTDTGLTVIPYRGRDGAVHNRRIVAPSGRCWWETSGLGLIPMGLETIPANTTDWALLICEGESDTLACREAFAGTAGGHHLRGFVVLGCPGSTCWQPKWREHVEGFDLIYPVGDGDEPGRAFAWSVQASVPWARPVRLPDGADARAILQAEGPRALDSYLVEADRDAVLKAAFWHADSVDEFCELVRQPAFGLLESPVADRRVA